jgi:hypothetical protein
LYLKPFVLSLSKHEHTKTMQLRRGLPGSKLLSFASPKESSQRKGDPGLPPLRGPLRCSTGQAAAELALRAQTVLAEIPRLACATRRRTGDEVRKAKTENRVGNKLPTIVKAIQLRYIGFRVPEVPLGEGKNWNNEHYEGRGVACLKY